MVEVYKERKALVLQWDPGAYDGPVTIETANVANLDDMSSTELVANPGFGAVSFPEDYSGEFQARILDTDGNVLDEGTVAVD